MTRKHDIALISIAFVALLVIYAWPTYFNMIGLEIDLSDCQPKWLPSKIDRAINPKSFWKRQAKTLYSSLKHNRIEDILATCEKQPQADKHLCELRHKTTREKQNRCLNFSMVQFRREGDYYLFDNGDQDD